MPGFAISGGNPDAPNATAEPKRKHRFSFEVTIPGISNEIFLYLQKAARPKVNQDKVEMWHNQGPAFYSGRSQWNPISVAFYDIENPDTTRTLWDWHTRVVTHAVDDSAQAQPVSTYKQGRGILKMLEPDDAAFETWTLYNCWPQSMDFSDVTYTSSEIQLVTVELVYDLALLS